MTMLRKVSLAVLSLTVPCFTVASAYDVAGIDVKPRATVSGVYDDNITFVDDGEMDDFITRLTLGLEGRAEGRTRTLDLQGNVNHELFLDNDDFDNTSGDAKLDFKQELGEHDRFRVRDTFVRADEPRTFEEAFNRIQGRYSYWRNRLLFDYNHDLTKQWSLTGRYGNEVTEFERDIVRDSMLNTAGAEALYQHTSTLKFLFAYDYETRDFENGPDAHTHTLSTGVLYRLTQQLSLEARVGVDFIESFDDDDFEEPLFRVRLSDELNEITTIDVAFEKEYSPTSYTAALFDYWQLSSTLRRQVNERLNAFLSGFYGEGDYVTLTREDELWGASAGLTYDITKSLKGSLRYTFTDVSSTLRTQEYTKNTVLLGLALDF